MTKVEQKETHTEQTLENDTNLQWQKQNVLAW